MTHELTEAFQFYLLKSSNQLAKEKGACTDFNRTKYFEGLLPIDTYKKDVDEISSIDYNYDWESLRSSILEQFGLRHSTLSAQMPSESSSVVSNATNGIEPPRGYLSIKKSKKGPLKQIVPQYGSLKNNYTLLWDMPDNVVILMLLLLCKSSLTKPSVETGPTTQKITQIMKYQFQ
jgi:ribonucleoside-diphosphate reductase alpha chain